MVSRQGRDKMGWMTRGQGQSFQLPNFQREKKTCPWPAAQKNTATLTLTPTRAHTTHPLPVLIQDATPRLSSIFLPAELGVACVTNVRYYYLDEMIPRYKNTMLMTHDVSMV